MANYWAHNGMDVTILTLCGPDQIPFYPLHEHVRWVPLGVMGDSSGFTSALMGNFRRMRNLRAAIVAARPDVGISFLGTTNVLTLLSTRGLGIPVIVSERSDPNHENLGAVWNRLRTWTYPWATVLVAQHTEAGDVFKKMVPGRIRVIPNPVSLPAQGGKAVDGSDAGPFVIGVGRLSFEKGFHMLVQTFGTLADRFPDWKLILLGEGPMRPKIEQLIIDTGLAGRVILAGNVQNPGATLVKASFFVLPSFYEGFPNALCEAMALGIAVAASNCSGGVREIIDDGNNGILFEPKNVEAMAVAMEKLMADPQARMRLGSAAREITKRFTPEIVMGLWETLLKDVTGKDLTKRNSV
jgi:glycosyltransferase involved in cell wall biosynthesis